MSSSTSLRPTATSGRGRPPSVAVTGFALAAACFPAEAPMGPVAAVRDGAPLRPARPFDSGTASEGFARVADHGLFGLLLPIACLVIGDAVMGADVRAGTLPFTWLSPVPFWSIAVARWAAGTLVAWVTIVPAFALAAVLAGVSEAAAPAAVATVFGAAAYVALFVLIGCATRRATVWSLGVVLLGEGLVATALVSVAQLSPRAAGVRGVQRAHRRPLRPRARRSARGWGAAVQLVVITLVLSDAVGLAAGPSATQRLVRLSARDRRRTRPRGHTRLRPRRPPQQRGAALAPPPRVAGGHRAPRAGSDDRCVRGGRRGRVPRRAHLRRAGEPHRSRSERDRGGRERHARVGHGLLRRRTRAGRSGADRPRRVREQRHRVPAGGRAHRARIEVVDDDGTVRSTWSAAATARRRRREVDRRSPTFPPPADW